jgi:GTP cyclohydrolase IA
MTTTPTLPPSLANWTVEEAARHPATVHARRMMTALGIDVDDEVTEKTPARFVKALLELTSGARLEPDRHFKVTFPAPSDDSGMVLVPGIPFVSICEHHLLTFTGTATVAYLPSGRIVGLSKIARVVQEYAARPQVQERLGNQIVTAINENLDTLGAACMLRAVHSCMTLRGAKAVGAAMVTSHLTGLFRTDPAARSEFLELARTGS